MRWLVRIRVREMVVISVRWQSPWVVQVVLTVVVTVGLWVARRDVVIRRKLW